ncbi:MAG: LacI family DNA-binding transcriptional regulator [Treponema sp.]|nr:LacI family DNA-binding transcriptional regulator [Treponema sp.]
MKAVSKQSTIYDVARLAGVSSATVSRFLNEPDRVTPDKRERIRSAVKELNFVPKAEAVAKARRSYKRIGVVAPFFTQPSFMERLRGIESLLSREHYELILYAIDTEEELENYIQMLINTQRVDGLIFLCLCLGEEMLSLLDSAPFPVCFVESEYENFDCVVVQNLQGGQKAAEYLYKKGCRNPGFIGEVSTSTFSVAATEERFRGFQFYFANQGITLAEDKVWLGTFSESNREKEISRFLEQGNLPDGVFCSSDVLAASLIRIAEKKRISVPEKIKVIGFDNIDIADYLGLTSVSQNLEESGIMAARLVLDRIADKERGITTMKVPLRIIERETCGE